MKRPDPKDGKKMSEATRELIAAVRELRDECDRVSAISRVLTIETLQLIEETEALRRECRAVAAP